MSTTFQKAIAAVNHVKGGAKSDIATRKAASLAAQDGFEDAASAALSSFQSSVVSDKSSNDAAELAALNSAKGAVQAAVALAQDDTSEGDSYLDSIKNIEGEIAANKGDWDSSLAAANAALLAQRNNFEAKVGESSEVSIDAAADIEAVVLV